MLCFGDARLAHIRCVHEISRGQPKAVHFLAAWGLLLFCEVQKASVSLALQIWLCTQMSFEWGAAKHPPVHELMPGRLYPSDAADSLYNTHTSPTFQSEMEPNKMCGGESNRPLVAKLAITGTPSGYSVCCSEWRSRQSANSAPLPEPLVALVTTSECGLSDAFGF